MISSTRARVSAATCACPFNTFDTVGTETPASRAISLIVARLVSCLLTTETALSPGLRPVLVIGKFPGLNPATHAVDFAVFPFSHRSSRVRHIDTFCRVQGSQLLPRQLGLPGSSLSKQASPRRRPAGHQVGRRGVEPGQC